MNPHAEAWRALRSWSAPSPAQKALRDRYLRHLADHPDALDRSCAHGHLTAGTLVLSADVDAVLLNLHRRAGRWFHFGGHWEPGDATLLATATREAVEESGVARLTVHPEPVHLDLHRVEFCRGHDHTEHLDVRYAALAPRGAVPRTSEESLDVRWWPLAGLPDLEPEMHELIALARARLRPSPGAQARSDAQRDPELPATPGPQSPGSSRAAVE